MRAVLSLTVYFAVLLQSLSLTYSVNAQSSPGLRSFTPPGPNASSLGKFGEVPVSMYTGIPSISIPLYSAKSGELELPISLDYHAGGIKVEEVASWVGLGFSLNAGGVVTRSIRGLPDEAQNGYFNVRASISALGEKYLDPDTPTDDYGSFQGNGLSEDIVTLEQILGQVKDGEPDIFYFNCGKYSGKFFMGPTGQFTVVPVQAMKVEYQTNSAGIMRWQITTPDGVRYIFGTTFESDPVRTAIEINQNTNGNNLTSWYLLEVLSPYNNRIDLTYTMESFHYEIKSSEVINLFLESNPTSYMDVSIPHYDKKVGQNYFQTPRLDNIKVPNGIIKFIGTTEREDIIDSHALDVMEVRGSQNELLKSYTFSYDYFQSSAGCPTGPQYCNRLKLEGIEEQSDAVKGAKYAFYYDNSQLPSWDPNGTQINSQDLWGFYNGVSNNILPGSMSFQRSDGTSLFISGSDRHSAESYMKAGVLTQITYPTGGYTAFDYEANRLNASDHDLNFTQTAGEGRSDFIEYETGQTVEKTITITDPDPNTGRVVMMFNNRQQVREMDYTVTPSRQRCAPDPNSGLPTCFEAYIEGVNGTPYSRHYLVEGVSTVDLLPGEYKLSGKSLAGYENFEHVTQPKIYYLQLNWTEYPQTTSIYAPTNKVVGGLRIARITNHSEGNHTVKRYLYSKFDDQNVSSAVIVNYPYRYANIFFTVHVVNNVASTATFGQVKSNSLVPLISSQGSVLGYANVTELEGENGENGKTQYTFTTASDYPDDIKLYRPYPPSCSFDFRRGLLRKKAVFVGNTTDTLQVTRNYYTFEKAAQYSYGISVEKEASGDFVPTPTNYYVSGFKTYSEFFFQDRQVNRTYSPPGSNNYVEMSGSSEYGWPQGHYQLIKSTTWDSKGIKIENINKYPADLQLSGEPETARQALLADFIVNVPLEQTTNRNDQMIEKVITDYKVASDGTVNPSAIRRMIGNGPLEDMVTFSKYDGFGNVLQQQRANDFYNSYLWDYNHQYVVAEAKNVIHDDFGYSSFEADDNGNLDIGSATRSTTDFRTGTKCYSLTNGSISKGGLRLNVEYKVSLWAKSGSISVNGNSIGPNAQPSVDGWQFYATTVTTTAGITTITISGTAFIDDVRVCPSEAQMTTYTYDPLHGLTSKTDANDIITFYDYDELGRLHSVNDQYKNLLKTYSYHYKE